MRALMLGLLLSLVPAGLRGQFLGPIEDLFARVDGLALYGLVGDLTMADELATDDFLFLDGALRGMGIELLIDLVPEPDAEEASAGAEGGLVERPGDVGSGDREPQAPAWRFELGLGADYLTGFEAEEPTLDLRGSTRGLPILAAYATAPIRWGTWRPYLGLNTGFLQLWNVKGYDPEGRQFDVEGETFQLGVAAGLYHESGFFLESSYRIRNFRSVEWGLPDGVDAVPEGWPRSLDVTALLFSVGYQFGRVGD